MRGFDFKSVPKPEKFDLKPEKSNSWHDLFTATMAANDAQWELILKEIESYGQEKITMNQRQGTASKLGMSEEVMKTAERSLYLNLLQYTAGDAHAKVTSGGVKDVLETYRHIVCKGKHATIATKMEKRMKVMSPEAARDIADIESKVTAWKGDIRYLQEVGGDDKAMLDNQDQMITILIGMMPEAVADHLIGKYEAGQSTLEEIEQSLDNVLTRVRNKSVDGRSPEKCPK